MKHIISPLVFAAMAWSATAQDSTLARAYEQQEACAASEMTKVLATLPDEKMVGSASEQGRDKLDSTYYLNKKERQQVELLTASLVKAYDADIKHHTGGFCHTDQLRKYNPTESQKLEMYYSENQLPLVVGGKGHNYVVLRHNYQQNPCYRQVQGAEWWLENDAVMMKVIRVSGPQTAGHYKMAMQQNSMAHAADAFFSNSELASALCETTKEQMLKSISILATLYRHTDSALDRAVVKILNERITDYLNSHPTVEEKQQLFLALQDIPGYYAVVKSGAKKSWTVSFAVLNKIYPQLDILCISFAAHGDPSCSVKKERRYRQTLSCKSSRTKSPTSACSPAGNSAPRTPSAYRPGKRSALR